MRRGGINIDVKKRLNVLEGEGANALIQTVYYKYNAAFSNQGTIFSSSRPSPVQG